MDVGLLSRLSPGPDVGDVGGTSIMTTHQMFQVAPSIMSSPVVSMTKQPLPLDGLPPKSPSSIPGRILQSTRAVVPKRQSKKRSSRRSSKRNGKADSSCNSSEECNDSSTSTSDKLASQRLDQAVHDLSQALPPNRSLFHIGSSHVDFDQNVPDDFFGMPDSPTEATASPTSVVDVKGRRDSTRVQGQTSHHRAKSWDGNHTFSNDRVETTKAASLPSIFRRQKVMSADVASVGNASDTLVTVSESGNKIAGRDLHEKAKEVLNAGDYTRAVRMFEALQKAQMDRFGPWHSSVGAATHNVGVVRLRMGQARRAEELFELAVAIRRKVLGSDHLDLAASLTKLGSARVALHKFDDGLQVLREALRVTRKTLGRSNKTVAQILCHIACLYYEATEYFSAQATFEDALDIYREVFPTEVDRDSCMAQMTEVICNIGSIHNKRKNFSGAIECFREALDLQRGVMGHDHPRVIASLDNLGYSFSKARSYNQALTCYMEMLSAQLSHFGSFSTECCDTLKKQILLFEKMRNIDGAINATKKAIDRASQDTLIPQNSVAYELENMLAELNQKKQNPRMGQF